MTWIGFLSIDFRTPVNSRVNYSCLHSSIISVLQVCLLLIIMKIFIIIIINIINFLKVHISQTTKVQSNLCLAYMNRKTSRYRTRHLLTHQIALPWGRKNSKHLYLTIITFLCQIKRVILTAWYRPVLFNQNLSIFERLGLYCMRHYRILINYFINHWRKEGLSVRELHGFDWHLTAVSFCDSLHCIKSLIFVAEIC